MFFSHTWLRELLTLTSLVLGNSLRLPSRNIGDTTSLSLTVSADGGGEGPVYEPTVLPVEPLSYFGPTDTSATNSSWQAMNTTSSGNLTAPQPKYRCDGAAFGRNLNIRSCIDALASIRNFEYPRTFGQRGQGTWDVNLPFRFLSDDGLCAIDLSLVAGAVFDTIMPSDLKLYGQTLIGICVYGTPNQGGVATRLGYNGNLNFRVTPYRPNVRCQNQGSAPPAMNCRVILDLMDTGGTKLRFGRRSDSTAQVKLPKNYITPEQRCVLAIDTLSNSDSSDYYKLWAAGIAVQVMCVEAKKAGGTAYGLGQDRNLFVTIWDHARAPGPNLIDPTQNISINATDFDSDFQ